MPELTIVHSDDPDAPSPTGGTFTVRWRHGVSDPIPHNAAVSTVNAQMGIAEARDTVTQGDHDRNPALALSCRVCNPPPRPEPVHHSYCWYWWTERPRVPVRHLVRRVLWGVSR